MHIYETHVLEDPRIPCIFHHTTTLKPEAKKFIQTNWHENVEILLITEGSGSITLNTEQFRAQKGDCVVVNSNSLHVFSADTEHFCYHCLIVDRAFCVANHFDTNRILFDPRFQDEVIKRLMLDLAAEYVSPFDRAYRVQVIRATVLQIMAQLCRAHSRQGLERGSDSHLLSCIKQALGWIGSEISRDISLDEAAAFVGLSKYYFAREFRRVTGYTFVTYVNLTRCEKAKVLLAENRLTIGEIGRACGFENQSYFTRTFRNYTGLLPSLYREKQLQKTHAKDVPCAPTA